MATKRVWSEAVPSNADDNGLSPNKRRKLKEETISEPTASFSNLPIELKVHIFSSLTDGELNNVAEVNRECNTARNNESLNQERTGTLVFTDATTPNSFKRKVREAVDVFVGNRTRLKTEGIERVDFEESWSNLAAALDNVRLPQVTCLDGSSNERSDLDVEYSVLHALSRILPNLREINLNNVMADPEDLENIFEGFQLHCSSLFKFSWQHSNGLYLSGSDFQGFNSLTELNLDNSIFSAYHDNETGDFFFYTDDTASYLLMNCRHLKRLSLKDARVEIRDRTGSDLLPQDVLIKMVRNHPTLRWLRSDLTAENVEMLKQERPEITFVSE